MATATSPPLCEQKVILRHVSWETYERLLREHQGDSGMRFTYDRGRLEIMVLSFEHEFPKHILALLVDLLAGEMEIDIVGAGSTTYRRRDLERGFEPDASFYVTDTERVRRQKEIDLATDPPPDLVIEIDLAHPSLNKLEVLAAVGVPEVWRYDGERVTIHRLENGTYVEVEQSDILPGVAAEKLNEMVRLARTMKRTEWQREVRAWAQSLRKRP